MRNLSLCFVSTLFLFACNQADEDKAQAPQEHKALYNAVNEPLEKARAVEQQLSDHAQQQSQNIDRATSENP